MGVFTRDEAEGAIPNGSVVEKVNAAEDDLTSNGTLGIIIGSLNVEEHAHALQELTGTPHAREEGENYSYFVQWETSQMMVVGIREARVREVDVPRPFDPDEVRGPGEAEVEFIEIPASSMSILPPRPDVCQVCAAEHAPGEPHTPNSLYWQTRRNMEGLPLATWEDALVDCTEPVRESWITALELKGGKIDREKLNSLLAERMDSE